MFRLNFIALLLVSTCQAASSDELSTNYLTITPGTPSAVLLIEAESDGALRLQPPVATKQTRREQDPGESVLMEPIASTLPPLDGVGVSLKHGEQGSFVDLVAVGSLNSATIHQNGRGNTIAGMIRGAGNSAVVTQAGTSNSVRFTQDGTGNRVSITQTSW